MKSEATKFMKDKEANDCGEASPKIILSDENLKTSAGENERSKMQNRAAQHREKSAKRKKRLIQPKTKSSSNLKWRKIFLKG